MSKRTKARELAMQMLYLVDMNSDTSDQTVLEMIQERLKEEAVSRFSWQLYSGTRQHLPSIDERIGAAADNWSLSRMACTDRNLIRLGCYEMDYLKTPPQVVIDEVLNLAKKFGSNNSSRFINGVLDKLAKPDNQSSTVPPTISQETPDE